MSEHTTPVRWAIVGLGSQAATVAALLQGAVGMTLVGVVSHSESHAKAFADRFSVPHAATSLAALCEQVRPEAVFICSPNHRHVAESLEALRLGIPVLCEKPMALSVEEASAVAAEVARTGIPYGVGFHLRFHPLVQQAYAWVRAGRLGVLQVAEAHWSVGRLHETTLPPLADAHKQWRETIAQSGGGASQARGVHLYDLVRYLTGARITQVSAFHHPAQVDAPDLTSLTLLRGEPSFLASIATSRLIPVPQNRFTLYGSEGTLELVEAFQVDGTGTLRFTNGKDHPEEIVARTPCNLYTEELNAFSAAVRRNSDWTGATAQDGVIATAVMSAAWRSVGSGCTESVDDTPVS